MNEATFQQFPEVAALLTDFSSGIATALGPQLLAIYLHGSLASGDFGPHSDIDFMVVTDGALPAEAVTRLAALHDTLAARYPHWGAELEGAYIDRADLRDLRPANDVCPSIERGERLNVCEQDLVYRVVHLYVLQRCGITLHGSPPAELLAPVSAADLRAAVLRILRGWWAPMLEDDSRLRDPHYRRYAVQTMCRILYTLNTGGVASKPQAAAWARERLSDPWRALIEAAEAWDGSAEPGSVADAQGFIAYALSLAWTAD